MAHSKGLVGEALAVDGAPAAAVAPLEVSALKDESLENAMDRAVFVPVSLAAGGQTYEVLHRNGHIVAKKTELEPAEGLPAAGDVEVDLLGDLGVSQGHAASGRGVGAGGGGGHCDCARNGDESCGGGATTGVRHLRGGGWWGERVAQEGRLAPTSPSGDHTAITHRTAAPHRNTANTGEVLSRLWGLVCGRHRDGAHNLGTTR